MPLQAANTSASIAINIEDLIDELRHVEEALERWKALDAKELSNGRLSPQEEANRLEASAIYTLVGQSLLRQLIERAHCAMAKKGMVEGKLPG